MGLVCPFPIRSISTAPYLSESQAEEKPCLAATFSGRQLLPSRVFLSWRQPRPENSLRPISRYAAEHVKTISAAQRSRPKETTTKTAVNHEKTAYSGCFGTPSETRTHYIPLRRRTLYPGEVRGLGERGVRELDLKYCSGCGCSCQASGKKTGRNPL